VSTPIPSYEPAALRAGDTWQWRREFADYPASEGWALKYRFTNRASGFAVNADADGAAYAISVSAATTAGFAAGAYDIFGWVEKGAEKHTVVDARRLRVDPDPRAGDGTAPLDQRTTARKILDKFDAALEAGDPALASYSFQTSAGVRAQQFRTLADVLTARSAIKAEVAREDAAAGIARGGRNPRHYHVRFGNG